MSSVSDFLPKPKHSHDRKEPDEGLSDDKLLLETGSGGNKSHSLTIDNRSKHSNALTVPLASDGSVDYSVLAKQGHGSSRIVQSSYDDLVPLRQREDVGDLTLARPTDEEIDEAKKATKTALDQILKGKSNKAAGPLARKDNEPIYIRYTPANQMGEGADVKHRQRIIKIIDVAEDPLAPPKFKHTKVPGGLPSPPPPVLRSPPRKVTGAEQEQWHIPPAISNWKNPQGYTIALDKRVAVDGRRLEEEEINDNKAKLAEALYAAERSAREEVKLRGAMQKKLAEKEALEREERLRQLAQQAREERSAAAQSIRSPQSSVAVEESRANSSGSITSNKTRKLVDDDYSSDSNSGSEEEETSDERKRRLEREQRKREAEKELRMSRMGREQRVKAMAKEQDRDISERVALGVAQPSKPSGEAQFDSRLFSQAGGLGASFNEDQVYDKSLFAAQEAVMSIYRPKGNSSAFTDADEELEKIGSERRFEGLGARGESQKDAVAVREGPVEFERESEPDPFGLDKMMDSQSGKKEYGLETSRKKPRNE